MKALVLSAIALSTVVAEATAETATYRVDRVEAFYSCSNEADAMTILTTSFSLPYWDAVNAINGYERSTCPRYSIDGGVIPAETLMAENINQPSFYDRWAIIKWTNVSGQVFYTPVMRSSTDGLWYDSISTVLDIRAINGVIDLFN